MNDAVSELALVVEDQLLVERVADAVRHAALDLALRRSSG